VAAPARILKEMLNKIQPCLTEQVK